MSRTVDFSKDDGGRPAFSCPSVAYGETATSHGKAGTDWDAGLGYWVTKDSGDSSWKGVSGWNCFYNQGINGDFYGLMEDIGTAPPLMQWFNTEESTDSSMSRYLPGTFKIFLPQGVYDYANLARFNLWNASGGAKYRMIYGGFTWPINAVLHYGGWQTVTADSNENVLSITDPSVACQRVAESACAKLKADWGNNIRIYVIKYRKQTQYKHRITGAAVNFKYDYLNNCTPNSSDESPYMQDVTTETDLKTALQTIATDIKSWAGHTAANHVDYPASEAVIPGLLRPSAPRNDGRVWSASDVGSPGSYTRSSIRPVGWQNARGVQSHAGSRWTEYSKNGIAPNF
jgi:hypothetical protein